MNLKQPDKQPKSDTIVEQPDEGINVANHNPAMVRKRHTLRPPTLKRRRGKAKSSVAFPMYAKGRQFEIHGKPR
ncbi:hypothetical protein MMC34_006215 [Xylographa carneopallida]|nr:hypothetical protein [Xylographa carneopallida]